MLICVQYGYPILPYVQLVYPLLDTTGTNAFYKEPALASSQETAIVRVNVDIIYSAAPIDLSLVDLELTVPSVPDGRFYVSAFYDL